MVGSQLRVCRAVENMGKCEAYTPQTLKRKKPNVVVVEKTRVQPLEQRKLLRKQPMFPLIFLKEKGLLTTLELPK